MKMISPSRATLLRSGIAVGAIIVLAAVLRLAPTEGQQQGAGASTVVSVFKDPNCGCCGKWVEHLRASGFSVQVTDSSDLSAVRERAGIPRHLAACHTAFVQGYVIEGHVPAQDIKRLLRERPSAKGIAVPGMPVGSPGMEYGDRIEPYDVLLFGEGEPQVYARHGSGS